MKNFLEKLKDFVYDYIDFVMIILVIVLIGAIIFWRLDILFNDTKIDEDSEEIKTEEQKEKEPKNDDNSKEEQKEENENTEENESEEENSSNEENLDINEDVKINIEEGSSSEKVAQTLLDNKLINDKREFLLRLSDLGLETRIHPGDFELNQNLDIDTIIKTLTNQI